MTAEEFRSIREKLNLTRAEFADALQLRPSFVASVEDGTTQPSKALIEFLGMIDKSEVKISRGAKGRGWTINRHSLKRRK